MCRIRVNAGGVLLSPFDLLKPHALNGACFKCYVKNNPLF